MIHICPEGFQSRIYYCPLMWLFYYQIECMRICAFDAHCSSERILRLFLAAFNLCEADGEAKSEPERRNVDDDDDDDRS